MYVPITDYEASNSAQQFVDSLKNTGFAVITHHPIDPQLISDVYQEWQAFYESDAKFNYPFDTQSFDGYYPFKFENAKGHAVKNLMEYFHIYPKGQYPTEVSGKARELYHQLCQLGSELLGWLQSALPDDIKNKLSMPLPQMIDGSERSTMRIIHYPPLQGDEEQGALRSFDHEDINLITLLPFATAGGLELKDTQDQWRPIVAEPGQICINAGDMLQMATQAYIPSTTHRVANPTGAALKTSRMSMPLFFHPRDEVELKPGVNAYDYFMQRMRENGIV